MYLSFKFAYVGNTSVNRSVLVTIIFYRSLSYLLNIFHQGLRSRYMYAQVYLFFILNIFYLDK